MTTKRESLLSAETFAAEIIKNDDEDYPFAHAHNRIVPLARSHVALVERLTELERLLDRWRNESIGDGDLRSETDRALSS